MTSRTMAVLALTIATACASDRPAAIAYDSDTCTYCHMQISDRRFAGVIVTRRGRSVKFDSIECLREYYAQHASEVASAWVSDFAHPGVMLLAGGARYVDLGAGRAPMGRTHAWVAVAPSKSGAAIAAAAIAGVDMSKARTWAELE